MRFNSRGCCPSLTALLFFCILNAGCMEVGVIPEGLVETGSLRSEEYVARYLYPELGITLELVAPREGDPALLTPGVMDLPVVYYDSERGDPTDALFFLEDSFLTGDATTPLKIRSTDGCSPDGLCRLVLEVPEGLDSERLFSLCIDNGEERICRKRLVYKYESAPNPLRIGHITDIHLGGIITKKDTLENLHRLMDEVEENRHAIDLVVVTGDIGHNGTAEEIRLFFESLDRISLPLVIVSGNHDYHDGHITNYLEQITPRLNHTTELGPYLIVAMDTGPAIYSQEPMSFSNKSVGLQPAQIWWLQSLLRNHVGPKFVMLHHPPYAFSWSVIGRRRSDFLKACKEGGVSFILAGHTHLNEVYDYNGTGYGLSLWRGTSPKADRLPLTLINARSTRSVPSYKIIELQRDGTFSYRFIEVFN